MIYGNKEKIKQYDLDLLEQIIGTTFCDTDLIDAKTLQAMSNFVQKYSCNLSVFLSNAQVITFVVGNVESDYIAEENKGDYALDIFSICVDDAKSKTTKAKSAMIAHKLRNYTLCDFDNGFRGAYSLVPNLDKVDTIEVQTVEYINKYGIVKTTQDNIKEIRKNKSNTSSTAERIEKAILVGVGRRGEDIEKGLEELKLLCETAGVEVVGEFTQTRKTPDQHYYIGSGKLDEITQIVLEKNADLLVFDNELSGQRIFNLEEALNVKVIDRSMLILDIFAKHAQSNEGRLQVNLAQMKYSYPRLVAYQNSQGKFGSGGVGMRGPGETKLEMTKRNLKDKIYKTQKEIEELKKQRELRRQNRKINKEKLVALVGYTNSGKSTLLNRLTKSNVLAENKLFATLDTTTRELFLNNNQKVLLTDTVGFIDKLPHEFIDAFSSTLEEATQADLLCIVVDNSSPNAQNQLDVVLQVLDNLHASQIQKFVVANKCDLNNELSFATNLPTIKISAKNGNNLEELKKMLCKN